MGSIYLEPGIQNSLPSFSKLSANSNPQGFSVNFHESAAPALHVTLASAPRNTTLQKVASVNGGMAWTGMCRRCPCLCVLGMQRAGHNLSCHSSVPRKEGCQLLQYPKHTLKNHLFTRNTNSTSLFCHLVVLILFFVFVKSSNRTSQTLRISIIQYLQHPNKGSECLCLQGSSEQGSVCIGPV